MERLWSPWRSQYVTSADGDLGCFFCEHLADEDDERCGILFRAERVFVLMNAFPYNSGHLMVAPLRHVGETTELTRAESHELLDVTFSAVEVLREAMKPHGFNVGMNQGAVAGAGIAAHLHQHVVPRWAGDQNFMPIIGRTRTLPELMSDTRGLLAEAWGTPC